MISSFDLILSNTKKESRLKIRINSYTKENSNLSGTP